MSNDWQHRDHEPPDQHSKHLPKDFRHCGYHMTPACVRALYGLPSPAEVAASYNNSAINSVGVFAYDGLYIQSDLNLFFTEYAPNIPNGTHPIGDSIDGAKVNQSVRGPFTYTSEETNLDTMVMYGIVYPQTITLYQTSPTLTHLGTATNFALDIQDFLDALDASGCNEKSIIPGDCGIYQPARVINLSYGIAEVAQPAAYTRRQCHEFLKLGLQGTTFTVSSGDFGVASQIAHNEPLDAETNGCIVPGNIDAMFGIGKSHNRAQNGTVFNGIFPGTCPYVLSVGGTRLWPNDTVRDAESAMILPLFRGKYLFDGSVSYSSAGGFSNYFSRPEYQGAAVDAYFSQHDPGYPYYTFTGDSANKIGVGGGLYNRAGRGFPDVSAIGARFPIFWNGARLPGGGTSCAAPIWASRFTLINEKRSEAGKGPVGFVNHVLYEHPEVFNDITNGTNPGCFTGGFPAVEGWDPITGLGTPNFPKLLDLFMSLP